MKAIALALAAAPALSIAAAAQTTLMKIHGTEQTDAYGRFIGSAGDIDGDGIKDLLVGSPGDATNGTFAGRVRVLSGRDGSVLREHFGDAAGDRFGDAAGENCGDVDADGQDDYVVGAAQTLDWITTGPGYVRVFSGATGAMIREWVGSELDAAWGDHPDAAGDANGDGHADLLIGAPYANSNGNDLSGAAYLYSGKDGTLLWETHGTSFQDLTGCSFATLGDLDGDGGDEFAVGSFGKRVNGVWRGQVQVISGKTHALLHEYHGGVDDWFGWELAPAGDVDADGFTDLLVGSPNDYYLDVPGEAHVYSGATGEELYCFSGAENGDQFGGAVTGLGDLDQDGYDDFIIGAPTGHFDPPFRGRARVYSGKRGKVLFEIKSGVDDDFFGGDFEVIGDVDGDGRNEWVVGAPESYFYADWHPGTIWVFTARDCKASWANYGAGWPGTLGVPSLTASNPPAIGEEITITIGNSAGFDSLTLIELGFAKATIHTGWDGDLLVAPPWVSFVLPLPAAGLAIDETVDPDVTLCGVEVDIQALMFDPGASDDISFTRGLELILGGS